MNWWQMQLKASLKSHALFTHKEDSIVDDVVVAMQAQKTPANHVLIRQHDRGDHFFVVLRGELEAFTAAGEVVKKYAAGDAFGELALLYTSPRACSVRSLEECHLFTLHRSAYRKLVVDSATDGRDKSGTSWAWGTTAPQELYRQQYKQVHPKSPEEAKQAKAALRTHPLFEYLDEGLLTEIVDVMEPSTWKAGEVAVTQGEVGQQFYLVHEGELEAFLADSPAEVLETFSAGSCFGEVREYELPFASDSSSLRGGHASSARLPARLGWV